jgi:sporulation protein YlmC with PRC-barrel domain
MKKYIVTFTFLINLFFMHSCNKDSLEFYYDEIDEDAFISGDYIYKESNEFIGEVKTINFSFENNQVRTVVYMDSSPNLNFEPIVNFSNDTLFLSVKRIYTEGETIEYKVIYAFNFNIPIKSDKKINTVIFLPPKNR